MKKSKIISYITTVVLAAVLSFSISRLSDFVSGLGNQTYPDLSDTTIRDTLELPDPIPLPDGVEAPTDYFYKQLTSAEKRVYNELYKAILKGENSASLPYSLFASDACNKMRIVRALTYDHPEFFWISCGYSTSSTSQITEYEAHEYPYWQYTSDKEDKIIELERAVLKVAELANGYGTHYEKIKFVHDYLIANAMYDHEALAECKKSVHDPSHEYIYSAYGCLVNGRTVCAGYAKAFQMVMQRLGYECLYVVGTAGGSHAWNCVMIEDEGYFIDVTWDDPDEEYDEANYEYFCITDEVLERTHTIGKNFVIPTCSATEYNYFKYNGYFLEKYDFDAVGKIVGKQMGEHIISIQFADLEGLQQAKNDLFENKKWSKLPAFSKVNKIYYNLNENQYTLNFYFE